MRSMERCRGLVAAGARHVSFGPPLGDDRRLAIRLLAEHVVPALRGGDHTERALVCPRGGPLMVSRAW